MAQHITNLKDYNVFVKSLSFKNFPFNELYRLEDKGFTKPSQYTTLWKFIIYSAICSMMADNETLDPAVSQPLKKVFNLDFEKSFSNSLSKLTDQSMSLSIIGSGASVSNKNIHMPNDTSWTERIQIMETLIGQFIDNPTYYIVFDELDEDYKDVMNIDRSSKYFELLIGLFKASFDVRSRFRESRRIIPIVFLRDDIYEIMRDNDKNKWTDIALSLNWSESALEKLLTFRIARAIDPDKELKFTEAIDAIFEVDSIKYGGGRKRRRHVFKHLLANTLMRPRDLISYMRECARISIDKDQETITSDTVRVADEQYAIRFRQEFFDEIHSAVAYIDEIFDIFAQIRKPILSISEFGDAYQGIKKDKKDYFDFNDICKILFSYSVIGNVTSGGFQVFRYRYPNALFNFSEKIALHRGLIKAFQIQ